MTSSRLQRKVGARGASLTAGWGAALGEGDAAGGAESLGAGDDVAESTLAVDVQRSARSAMAIVTGESRSPIIPPW
jgi:hypothetical protein